MKLISAFFRLVRWPNLVFIALTQLLFYYSVIIPSLPDSYFQKPGSLNPFIFYLLVTASVLIAAAGYIINDYFDINIDLVNKPSKMVVQKIIKRRWAIFFHLAITFAGLVLSAFVAFKTSIIIIVGNIVCAFLLWVYSTTFKKKLLSGNIIISGLTAWTVMVLYFATNNALTATSGLPLNVAAGMYRIYKFAALYAGFAFIISLIREVVKDIEDREGDARYNCKTMPIVWGVPASKVFVGVWLVVLAGALIILQFYVIQIGWWVSALYVFLFVIIPLFWILKKFYIAQNAKEYHLVSTAIKLVMLTGICSMIFIKFYAR
jgi:4-hydroxybenzoate polyprenyltransferase